MKLNADGLEVTQDEATELCIHHLRLAAVFFETGAEDLKDILNELNRQHPMDDLRKPAMIAFCKTIWQTYEDDKAKG